MEKKKEGKSGEAMAISRRSVREIISQSLR